MKKDLLFTAVLILLATLTSVATTLFSRDGEPIEIIIVHQPTPTTPIHRTDVLPIKACFNPFTSEITVSFADNLGTVAVTVVNYTTGETVNVLLNSSISMQTIPVSGLPGDWGVSFTLPSGDSYYGEFEIE